MENSCLMKDALERCYRTFLHVERIDLDRSAWGVLESDEHGNLVIGDLLSLKDEEGPSWRGPAGTHPMIPILQRALGIELKDGTSEE